MALFGFGKKKEEVKAGCNCGETCESNAMESKDSGCCCGGNNLDNENSSDSFAAEDTVKKEDIAIKVLGSGCAKCNQLEAATKEALGKLGMDTTIDHVTDFTQIASYGVMSTPALVIDGKVVSYGKVLKTEEVIKLLEKVRG